MATMPTGANSALMGYSGDLLTRRRWDLFFESAAGRLQDRIENGVATDYSEEEATRILSEKKVTAVGRY